MSDHADERHSGRLWGDGYTVGTVWKLEAVAAALRAIYATRPPAVDWHDLGLLEEAARALGVTLAQEGGE